MPRLSRFNKWVERKHRIQFTVLSRDNFTCQLKVTPECYQHDHLECHHIKPKYKGGLFTPANLIAVCQRCHDDIQPPQFSIGETKA